MNLRRMLLIFIPALFILNNGVSFFIFQSGRTVQQSYNLMLDRVLLYKQIAGQTEEYLHALNSYLGERSESGRAETIRQGDELKRLRERLSIQAATPATEIAVRSYRNMIDTFSGQTADVLKAVDLQGSAGYAGLYEEAEKTASFIREKGHQLVDAELSYDQPYYRQILNQMEAMNRWGVAVFILNTLLGVAFAYRISLGISRPIRQLVVAAKQISRGNLKIDLNRIGVRGSEFGILSEAFAQMQHNLKRQNESDKESLEKDRLVKELELRALQNQINPHFLFNSLNVLSKLALLEGAEKTSDLTVSMSNLLRYNLRQLDRPVTLGDEIGHAEEYFAIQQARFRDRIRFVTEIDEAGLGVLVPALTLQPLLENVFVHGIEGMEEGAVVRLAVECLGDEVHVFISDNGIGMSDEARESLLHPGTEQTFAQQKGQSTGLGTRNVFRRLELFYGRQDLVDIRSAPGRGTTVILRLPAGGKEGDYVPVIDRG